MMAKMTIITKMTKIAMMIMIDDKDSMIDDKDSMFQDHGDLRGYVGDPGGGDSRTHAEGIQECTNCQAKSGQLRVLSTWSTVDCLVHEVVMFELRP